MFDPGAGTAQQLTRARGPLPMVCWTVPSRGSDVRQRSGSCPSGGGGRERKGAPGEGGAFSVTRRREGPEKASR